jgi:membrane-associated protein
MLISLFVAAVVGDAVGYYSGRKMGKAIFNRPKSRFSTRNTLEKAHAFYEKYAAKQIIIARFVPIVRTFAPIVAGAAADDLLKISSFKYFRRFLVGPEYAFDRLFPRRSGLKQAVRNLSASKASKLEAPH